MIDKALTFISDFLNKELNLIFGLPLDKVVVSSLINPEGSVTANIENKIVISVINLEHETATKQQGNYINGDNNQYGKVFPPVYLNIYILISANYQSQGYMEALKMLSAVIGILQATPLFERSAYPDMDPSVSKLSFELFNIPISEISHIWSGIGAKYVPSIIYKVRMLKIQKDLITKLIAGVSGLENNNQPK